MDAESELRCAYRALYAFHNAHVKGQPLSSIAVAYHSPSIAAARRWVKEGALDGSEYFIGKPVAVLHAALKAEQ